MEAAFLLNSLVECQIDIAKPVRFCNKLKSGRSLIKLLRFR
jgi:hypothetical protein